MTAGEQRRTEANRGGQRRAGADRGGQRQTGADRGEQGRKEADRGGQRRTEADRDEEAERGAFAPWRGPAPPAPRPAQPALRRARCLQRQRDPGLPPGPRRRRCGRRWWLAAQPAVPQRSGTWVLGADFTAAHCPDFGNHICGPCNEHVFAQFQDTRMQNWRSEESVFKRVSDEAKCLAAVFTRTVRENGWEDELES